LERLSLSAFNLLYIISKLHNFVHHLLGCLYPIFIEKTHMSLHNALLVIAVSWKLKINVRTAAILLFYILQRNISRQLVYFLRVYCHVSFQDCIKWHWSFCNLTDSFILKLVISDCRKLKCAKLE
jgi:hypothetical protein